jgi:transglutaminase-like putative cysteine protease
VSHQSRRPKGAGTNVTASLVRAAPGRSRALALAGVAVLLGASLQVLGRIVDVAGDGAAFWLVAGGAVVAATVLSRVLRVVTAFTLGVVLLTVGLGWYTLSLPYDPDLLAMLASNLELLSGKSLLSIERAPIWALAVTPAPVFLAWYLALRRWYASAVGVGAASLAFFVLTGNAGTVLTLLGVVGGAAALGFGDLDRRPGSAAAGEYVVLVLAVMIVVPALVSVVPASAGTTLSLTDDGGSATPLEGDLIATSGDLDVAGSIELSPEVRFTVHAERPRKWRVQTYDRYTGSGWVRTGGTDPIADASLRPPPGDSARLEQSFEAESAVDLLPAAWRPTNVSGAPTEGATVERGDTLIPAGALAPGDRYSVTSAVPTPSVNDLRDADRDYPERVRDSLQLPGSTPDRVARRTDRLTAEADNPYDTARTLEAWLRNNRDYSLDVEDPGGNVADAFLFEMDAGYCVYYATTMTVMLRTQDIPARVVSGYTPGQEVGADRYLVRGYDSHAWVEAYFPGQGWIAFDPTPANPRQVAEQARLEEARAEGAMAVDAGGSAPETTSTQTPTTDQPTDAGDSVTETPGGGGFAEQIRGVETPEGGQAATDGGDGDGGLPLPDLPSRREMALVTVALVGIAAGVRRTGLGRRVYRAVWLRYQPRRDPETDVERAYRRVLTILEGEHRPMEPGETPRQYLDAVDPGPRVRRVFQARERLRHGPGLSDREVDDAVELADRLVDERLL